MDFDRTFQAPVIVVVGDGDGETLTFPRLTCSDLAVYQAEIKASRIADAQALAKDAGLSPREKYDELLRARQPVTHEAVWAWCITPDGCIRVLRDSLKKAGTVAAAEQDTTLAKTNPADHPSLVERITGYYVIGERARAEMEKQRQQEKPKADDAEGFRPLPGAGAT